MGVHSAKAMVLGCLLANILGIAVAEEGGRTFAAETHGDDVTETYCQFKGGCLLTPPTIQAEFIEAEPTTDEQVQTMACNGNSDRHAPQQGQRKALAPSIGVSA